MAVVIDGWGWLYTDDDEMFARTINKHIELLCDAFDVRLADPCFDAMFTVYHYETAESFYFEGNKRNLQILKDYFEGKFQGQELWADKQLDKIWQEYYSNSKQYDWIEQLEEEERWA